MPGTGPTNEHQSLPLEGRQPHHLLIGNDIQLVKNWGGGETRQRGQSWLGNTSTSVCVSDQSQVLGQKGRSGQDWARSSSRLAAWEKEQQQQQAAREGQSRCQKPGLLLLSDSAQDSRTWELGWRSSRMPQGACCWGSFIYLGDLQPCLLLVGAAGWARSQQSLGTHLCQLFAQFSMGCLHGWLRGSSLPHQGQDLAAVGAVQAAP